jgi:uncharacterized OB-fold protein
MKGKCPKCGARYYGWALKEPVHQYCDECGSELDVYEETDYSWKHYMVLSYPRYEISYNTMKELRMAN